MLRRPYLLAIVAACFSHFFAGDALAEDPAVPSAQEVAEQVREAGRRIVNLHVPKYEARFEVLAPGATEWKEEPNGISGKGWYAGRRHSKARVDVTRKMEWEDGPAKWVEMRQDLGFDGQFGRIAHHSSAHSGTTRPDRTGELLPEAPSMLRERFQSFADGTGFTLGYYVDSRGRELSERLTDALKEGAKPQVTYEKWRGDRVVRLTFGHLEEAYISYWFHPARGWALVKAEQKMKLDGTWPVPERVEVLELAEASPGVWYPTEALREEPYPGKPGHRLRVHYKSTGAVANDPNFDETVFAVPYPEGYLITDRVRDLVFEAPGGVITPVTEEPKNILQKGLQGPAEVPPVSVPAPPAAAVQDTPDRMTLLLIAAAAVAVIVLVSWVLMKRGHKGVT